MAARCGQLMAVNGNQSAPRQLNLSHLGHSGEQIALGLGPLAGDIVVSNHRDHPAMVGLQGPQHPRVADVAAVDGQVAFGDGSATRVSR